MVSNGVQQNNKEYWDYLKKQSFEKNNESNSKSVSFSVGDSDDDFYLFQEKSMKGEKIHGFQTKKYTTIFETIKNRIKIDEWAVKELSLLRIADTLNKELLVLLVLLIRS